MTKLIRQINFPADLRKFDKDKLKQISDELRDELIDVVSETGGHLGAELGGSGINNSFALCIQHS